MATPSEAISHPAYAPLKPSASEAEIAAHTKKTKLRLQFLWAQYRMQWAAKEDTSVSCAEISVCRRMLIAHRDTDYQLQHVEDAIQRITKKHDLLKDELKAAQAYVKKLTAQIEDQADQLDGMRRTKEELTEMRDCEQEFEEDCRMAEAMHEQQMQLQGQIPVINLEATPQAPGAAAAKPPPPPPPPVRGVRDPSSGLPAWRTQQSIEAKMDQKLQASLQPMQATLTQMALMMQSLAATAGLAPPTDAISSGVGSAPAAGPTAGAPHSVAPCSLVAACAAAVPQAAADVGFRQGRSASRSESALPAFGARSRTTSPIRAASGTPRGPPHPPPAKRAGAPPPSSLAAEGPY